MKKQGNHYLVEYLLRTRPKFKRGTAGRRHENLCLKFSVPAELHILSAYWGWDVSFLHCEMLEFALKHPSKTIRKKNNTELVTMLGRELSRGNIHSLVELAKALKAIKRAPHDPLTLSLMLALQIIPSSHPITKPTQAQVVAIAEDFFEMKTERERNSVRGSLFRTAKKLLQSWAP